MPINPLGPCAREFYIFKEITSTDLLGLGKYTPFVAITTDCLAVSSRNLIYQTNPEYELQVQEMQKHWSRNSASRQTSDLTGIDISGRKRVCPEFLKNYILAQDKASPKLAILFTMYLRT